MNTQAVDCLGIHPYRKLVGDKLEIINNSLEIAKRQVVHLLEPLRDAFQENLLLENVQVEIDRQEKELLERERSLEEYETSQRPKRLQALEALVSQRQALRGHQKRLLAQRSWREYHDTIRRGETLSGDRLATSDELDELETRHFHIIKMKTLSLEANEMDFIAESERLEDEQKEIVKRLFERELTSMVEPHELDEFLSRHDIAMRLLKLHATNEAEEAAAQCKWWREAIGKFERMESARALASAKELLAALKRRHSASLQALSDSFETRRFFIIRFLAKTIDDESRNFDHCVSAAELESFDDLIETRAGEKRPSEAIAMALWDRRREKRLAALHESRDSENLVALSPAWMSDRTDIDWSQRPQADDPDVQAFCGQEPTAWFSEQKGSNPVVHLLVCVTQLSEDVLILKPYVDLERDFERVVRNALRTAASMREMMQGDEESALLVALADTIALGSAFAYLKRSHSFMKTLLDEWRVQAAKYVQLILDEVRETVLANFEVPKFLNLMKDSHEMARFELSLNEYCRSVGKRFLKIFDILPSFLSDEIVSCLLDHMLKPIVEELWSSVSALSAAAPATQPPVAASPLPLASFWAKKNNILSQIQATVADTSMVISGGKHDWGQLFEASTKHAPARPAPAAVEASPRREIAAALWRRRNLGSSLEEILRRLLTETEFLIAGHVGCLSGRRGHANSMQPAVKSRSAHHMILESAAAFLERRGNVESTVLTGDVAHICMTTPRHTAYRSVSWAVFFVDPPRKSRCGGEVGRPLEASDILDARHDWFLKTPFVPNAVRRGTSPYREGDRISFLEEYWHSDWEKKGKPRRHFL